jgi:hypothetical protein
VSTARSSDGMAGKMNIWVVAARNWVPPVLLEGEPRAAFSEFGVWRWDYFNEFGVWHWDYTDVNAPGTPSGTFSPTLHSVRNNRARASLLCNFRAPASLVDRASFWRPGSLTPPSSTSCCVAPGDVARLPPTTAVVTGSSFSYKSRPLHSGTYPTIATQ